MHYCSRHDSNTKLPMVVIYQFTSNDITLVTDMRGYYSVLSYNNKKKNVRKVENIKYFSLQICCPSSLTT